MFPYHRSTFFLFFFFPYNFHAKNTYVVKNRYDNNRNKTCIYTCIHFLLFINSRLSLSAVEPRPMNNHDSALLMKVLPYISREISVISRKRKTFYVTLILIVTCFGNNAK